MLLCEIIPHPPPAHFLRLAVAAYVNRSGQAALCAVPSAGTLVSSLHYPRNLYNLRRGAILMSKYAARAICPCNK